jgi:TonB-linked SusC/RagA family outer membrane protein
MAGQTRKAPRQAPLTRPARLHLVDATLGDALKALHYQSGVDLVFSPSALPSGLRVTCICSGLTVEAALERLLDQTHLAAVQIGNQVLISEVPPERTADSTADLLPRVRSATNASEAIRLTAGSGGFQGATVAGVVVDARARPVSGARVSVSGTSAVSVTDRDGRFRLDNVSGTEVTLAVAAIGYRPLTVTVTAGRESLRITMTEMPVNLEEVVVTGTTGATQRRQLGNSIATLQASEITEIAPVKNVGQMLNARAAGVVIQPRTGLVGSGPRVKIRGNSTFFLNDQPLIYIDGVRADSRTATTNTSMGGRNSEMVSRLNDFNPEDIESIEIIRGPAAATLYGTEASNGVVQIITKKGRADARPEVEASVRGGANWFMNPEGRLPKLYSRDAGGQVVSFNILEREASQGRHMFQTGPSQGYAGSVRGGGQTLQYYGSLSYDDEEGVEPTNSSSRFSSRLNLAVTPASKFEVNVGLATTQGEVNIPNSSSMFSMFYADAAQLNTPRRGFSSAPPEVYWRNYRNTQDYRRTTLSVDGTHRPTTWLTQRLRTGVDFTNENNTALVMRMTAEDGQFFGAAARLGSIREERITAANYTVDYSATATASVSKSLASTTSVGVQYFRRRLESVVATGTEFPTRGVTTVSSAAIRLGFQDTEANATAGVFVQEQLAWKNRLFLTAAVRGDDNSAFGEDFNLVLYPKVGLSWAVSDEPFAKVPFVDRLRLRAAYGASGQQPSTFAAVRTYRPVTGGTGTGSITTSSVGNPNLKPERGEELEVGFEASLFRERVGLDFTYYDKRTNDAILLLAVRPSLGFTGQQFINAGSIRNRGVELLATGLVVDGRNTKWTLGLNLSTNSNEVTDLGGADFLAQDIWSGFKVGYPVGSYFQRRIVAADLSPTGVAQNLRCDGGPELNHQPVTCDVAPRVFMGRQTPKVEGAISSEVLLFGRLRLYGLVDFKRGHRLWNADHSVACRLLPRCRENFFPQEFDPITLAYVQLADDQYVEPYLGNASFFKLRELSIGYALPERLAAKVGAKRATITVAGRNLHTWANWFTFDPESFDEFAFATGFGNTENLRPTNADISTIPQLAQFIATVRVVF